MADNENEDDIFAAWTRQQEEMAAAVSVSDAVCLQRDNEPLRYVAGMDTSTVDQPDMDFGGSQKAVACLSVCEMPGLEVVYQDFAELDLTIPYCSGFLGFREVPVYCELLKCLQARCMEAAGIPYEPDAVDGSTACVPGGLATCGHTGSPVWPQVVLVDGFGVLHHRRCGSASHLGVECTTPTVGVGKTLLQMEGLNERHVRETISKALQAVHENHALPSGCYTQQTPRGETVACMELLSEGSGEVLGVAVGGMNASQRPIYISRGHMVSLQTAVDITLACCTHRIPEPIRQSDLSSRECVRKLIAQQEQPVT